jgi:type IV secretory pathway TrbD component
MLSIACGYAWLVLGNAFYAVLCIMVHERWEAHAIGTRVWVVQARIGSAKREPKSADGGFRGA